ncbi:MAG: L-fuconolactonase [Acidobacteriaceae bacterium]|jgi:predicted TIM-barrel fold metal-dependent hydrolase|nr:L-fuconolactonase [Acidobacteriaceae bacterium]MEA3006323.1 L-fuconolactonase [Acidobacteriaceae bacterium]
MKRRKFLTLAASVAGGVATSRMAEALPPATPIIDTHIHLFDPGRPGGVPWPAKTDKPLYKAALPGRYAGLARPFGVVGAIVVEASPLASDNDWVLGQAAGHPIIVGMVGDLIPGTPSYAKDLDRLHGNPLFLGIRYGNLWDRDLAVDAQKPVFLLGLKMLADRGLVLDSANPDLKLIRAIAGVSGHLPELRIVIDHLPTARIPSEAPAREEYWSLLRHLAKNKNVFVKLSEVIAARIEEAGGPAFAQERLDALWEIFGEDHVLYASDWPNSDHHATYQETISIIRSYVEPKGPVASEKFFWKNSIAAYRWHPRQADQPREKMS